MVKKLDTQNFADEVLNTSGTVLVDFYADWCGPCKMVSPIVHEIAEERTDIIVGKANVDESAALAKQYKVMSIPTLIVFMSMDKRLAIFLLDEISVNGTDMVEMTHEQIARHLGTAREVVTRMLRHFSSDGWIEVTRKGIKILDKTKLRDIAY